MFSRKIKGIVLLLMLFLNVDFIRSDSYSKSMLQNMKNIDVRKSDFFKSNENSLEGTIIAIVAATKLDNLDSLNINVKGDVKEIVGFEKDNNYILSLTVEPLSKKQCGYDGMSTCFIQSIDSFINKDVEGSVEKLTEAERLFVFLSIPYGTQKIIYDKGAAAYIQYDLDKSVYSILLRTVYDEQISELLFTTISEKMSLKFLNIIQHERLEINSKLLNKAQAIYKLIQLEEKSLAERDVAAKLVDSLDGIKVKVNEVEYGRAR